LTEKKQKRRGHGEGTIFQRKDGRWVAEISLEHGKRKPMYGKTRKEVADKLNQALQEQKQGTLIFGPRQRLGEYLQQWFEEVHKQEIRVTTYMKHRCLLNKHIIPALGHVQLQKLTPQHIQTFYTQKLNEGLAPGSVKNLHKILRNALKNAVRWSLVTRNVCDQVSPPRETKREPQILTLEQAIRLLNVSRGHQLEALIALALTTGMRHGELIALRWHDVSFHEESLHVRHSVSRIGGYGYIEGDPKTLTSKREIVLPHFVVELLKEHRTQQIETLLNMGANWKDQDLVFCNASGGFLSPDTVLRRFRLLLQEAELPSMRLHDLRHSVASMLILVLRMPAKLVQELLGHSEIGTNVNIYTHTDISLQRKMMGDVNTLFEGKF
jgi:integrase